MKVNGFKCLLLLAVFFLNCQANGANSGVVGDTVSYSRILDEVEIVSISERRLIKKVQDNLFDLGDDYSRFLWGNGQHIQITRSSGRIIQLSREYGFYTTSGFHVETPKSDTFDAIGHYFSFSPVFNARSQQFSVSGSSVLPRSYLYIEGNPDARKKGYNALRKYVFECMRYIGKYGPVFAPVKQYRYELESEDESDYVIRFVTADRFYPKKNPIFAKGTIVVDKKTCKLKEIRVDQMEFLFARYVKKNRDVNGNRLKQAKATDCIFRFNEYSEPYYASVTLDWDDSVPDFDDQNCQPRPNAAKNDCHVTEYWLAESTNIMPLNWYVMSCGSPDYLKLLRDRRLPKQSKYDETAVNTVKWTVDVSEYEKSLSAQRPIKEQYLLQSDAPFDSFEDEVENGEFTDTDYKFATIEEYEKVKSLLFKMP